MIDAREYLNAVRAAESQLQLKIRQLINAGGDLASMVVRADVNYNETTLGAAAVVFAIIPIIAVYPWVQKYFAKGAMLGSVKG